VDEGKQTVKPVPISNWHSLCYIYIFFLHGMLFASKQVNASNQMPLKFIFISNTFR